MTIPFPTFESHLQEILTSAECLQFGDHREGMELLARLSWRLSKIRRSVRHRSLAEFVDHALLACERDDFEAAATLLISAAACFTAIQAA